MTSMEQGSELPAVPSADETPPRRVWFKDRAFGLLALALAAAGQVAVLLAALFTPEVPTSILDIDPFRSHWTDDLADWWLGLTGVAGLVALLGLVADKHRDIAAIALTAAVIGFLWPWGAAWGT